MKRLRFDPRARQDLEEATEYYGPSVAAGFLDAIEHVLEILCHHPFSGTAIQRGARTWPLSKYPYLLVYRVEGDDLILLAVAHMRRHAGFWRKRL